MCLAFLYDFFCFFGGVEIAFPRNHEVVEVHKKIYKERRGFLTRILTFFSFFLEFLMRFVIFRICTTNFVGADLWP